tara:strand:- start:30066 stop:31388 length:1323 start_codon:yes stop_codon:yes gene_type:complete
MLGLLAAATLLPGSCAQARSINKKIIVIGAGMAGLTAARKLQDSGYSVEILEARNRAGGRMWTDTSLGIPLDLGPAWVHGAEKSNPLASLVRQHSIGTFTSDSDSVALYHGGREISDASYEAIDEATQDFMESARRLKKGASAGESMERTLDELPEDESALVQMGVRWNFASEVEIELAADAKELSLKYWDEDYAFSGPEWLLKPGFGALAQKLAAGLTIRTGVSVKTVRKTATGVGLDTSAGSFECDTVVVTVPLEILRKGAMRFEPGLSQKKLHALKRMRMGTMNKVALAFDRNFWPAEIHRMGNLKEGPIMEYWNMAPVHGKPVLVALSAGSFARSLEAMSEPGIQDLVLSDLRSMFGKVPEPRGMIRTKWYSDPYTGGSYSMIAAGSSVEDFETLADPDDDRIFFAGEACNSRYPGTLHGALISGQKVAEHIVSNA